MMRYLTIVFFLFILQGSSWGQSDFRFRNYSINDGLSQSSGTCIIQDELNSLWIGTQDGLNRYDGKNFEIFLADDTEGLESSYIKCAAVGFNSTLWFGTTNGLTKYDLSKEVFQTYKTSSVSALQIGSMAVSSKGHIWVGSDESGLYKFEIKTGKFQSYIKQFPSRKIRHILEIKEVGLLIYTEELGLQLFDPENGKIETFTIDQNKRESISVNKLIADGDENVMLATNQGVYRLSVKTGRTTKLFPELTRRYGEQNVSDVFQHNEIGWFIATSSNGLFTLYNNGVIQHNTEDIFQKNTLSINELNEIFQDNSGTIWLGSQRGLSSFNPLVRGFLGIGPSGIPEKGLPTASVWSFAETNSGRHIFIGTDKAVSKLDRESGTFKQYYRAKDNQTAGKGEMAVLSLFIIDDWNLLVGCADGLYRLSIGVDSYSFDRIKLDRGEELANHERVYSIVRWKGTQCLLATKDGAIMYDYANQKKTYFEHDAKRPSESISKGICRLVYKDLHGRIWLTTSSGGLNILSERGNNLEIRPYEYNSIIKRTSTDYITSIYHHNNGTYWFGTFGSGLIRWNEKTKSTTVFNKTSGLPNDVIYGILPDEKSQLWLSTNKGICSFSMGSHDVRSFKEEDGLMSNEFNIGAFMKTKDKQLFFGGIYGYNYFKPSDLTISTKDILVVFTRFKLENEWLKPNKKGSPLDKPIFKTKEIDLTYTQRSFTLRFQPSDLSNPDQVNYKYRLEGSDEGEILLGAMNEIHFNALSSGTYVLKVYARVGEGRWSTYPAVLTIHIAAPFWATWWFWTIIAVILGISIRVFIRQRIELSKREQARLETKVRDRTKEIQKQNEKIEAQKVKIEEERNNVIEQQRLLQIEKDKTEKLLKNVIPASMAEELKSKGKARARSYKSVSVLFTDFVGFTQISDRTSASELVKKLDVYFTKFDEIIVKNNLEKIKTIGDAYMCAGGVPVRNKTNAIDTCLAALQIQAYMKKRKDDALANGQEFWELRLGINTGEVTAGVIGSERLAYDIWGATVNQAQRMEMLGEPEKVTITGNTHQLIEPYFDTVFKGKAQTKSRGLIDMYVVERIKPELSIRGEGVIPNKKFSEIVNLHHFSSINYYKAERHIMKLLEQHLSSQLHYHSIAHTKDVVTAVERLALREGVTDEGLFLLKSAATYHDAGFVEQYDSNEPIGARLAQEILPKYGYTDEHIDKIKELIFVTKIPHAPKNKLEEIICDADLDYLGRDDFHEIADRLRKELREHGKINSDRLWDEIQVKFLNSHKYFTSSAIKLRQEKKDKNLLEIVERLKRDEYVD